MVFLEMSHGYQDIISIQNLCEAWSEFVCGKRFKKDVAEFGLNLSENIFKLHEDLLAKMYQHGPYEAFSINDSKSRSIHKSMVRDRLLHHAIYKVLYSHFDKKFISDSYSCRYGKGTHKANDRFRQFMYKVSESNNRTCWVLKCDVKKFFASIDQTILMEIVKKHVDDAHTIWLIESVVKSFQSTGLGKGLPLGNLTSQLLVNVYMNEFDQYVKHVLKQKYYIRYADDFVIMHHDKQVLVGILVKVSQFLEKRLKLTLHPDKVSIQTFASGVDFLGWVHFPTHKVLRTTTKKRMFRNLADNTSKESRDSYLGLLSHGNTSKLRSLILSMID